MRPACIVLAGGQGRRMGGADKALLRLHGRTLIDHVLARMAPQVSDIAISANGDPARFAVWGLPVLPDEGSHGPLSGLLSGMRWAAALGHRMLLSVPTDTPMLPEDLVERLIAAGPVACAVAEGRSHPVIALWPVTLAAALADAVAAGERRVGGFAVAHGVAGVEFAAAALVNLNSAEELERLENCRPATNAS